MAHRDTSSGRPRVICVGHAALDRIYRVEAFPRTPTKIRSLEMLETGGGMAASAAVAIARCGGAVELWSRVGSDPSGALILKGLKAEGVDVSQMLQPAGLRSATSAIIVDAKGERLIVGDRGDLSTDASHLPLERVAGAGCILADVRWLAGARAAFKAAKALQVPCVLDAELGAADDLPGLVALSDFAIFSEGSLAAYGAAFDLNGRDESLKKALGSGCRHAGVTLGERGYRWISADGAQGSQPGFKVDVVDTTGAGDAFHGLFALSLAEGRDTHDCARRAAAAAALKCRKLGAQPGMPIRDELDSFLSSSPPLVQTGDG